MQISYQDPCEIPKFDEILNRNSPEFAVYTTIYILFLHESMKLIGGSSQQELDHGQLYDLRTVSIPWVLGGKPNSYTINLLTTEEPPKPQCLTTQVD